MIKWIIPIIYLTSIGLSAVLAFFYRKYLKERQLTILLPYLIFVFIQESGLTFLGRLGYLSSTAIFYNFYRPINTLVFAFIYYRIPFMKPFRKTIVGITAVYIGLTLVNYILIESIFSTSSYLAVARGLVITLIAILFLFTYFNLDDNVLEKYWRPLIWVTAGVIIFYPVTSISLAFQKFVASINLTILGLKLYQFIPQVMSIFMYSCFSYAFYLCYRIKQPSLSQ